LLFAIVPRLYAVLSRLLFCTYRVEVSGQPHFDQLTASGRPFIGVIWHYSVLYALSYMKGKNWVAMVSTSRDAEYISRFLTISGMTTVRGSSNKGGSAALRGLLTQMKRYGKNAAIVADGSQGPPLKAQPGAVLAASITQAPVLPLIWAAERYWAVKSWDRTVIPKPFSRVKIVFGEPIIIPPKISAEAIGQYTLALEKCLLGLYTEAWVTFGVPGHGLKG
jgi:hypothetical protein